MHASVVNSPDYAVVIAGKPFRAGPGPSTPPAYWLITVFLVLVLLVFSPHAIAQAAVPVSIQPLGDVLVDLERSAPAEVLALNHAVLASEVIAIVRQVNADVGTEVKKGDVLLQLDDTDYQLALQQAEAALASSKAQKAQADVRLQRARQLIEGSYLSADDLLARETEAQVANAQIQLQQIALAIARRNLEKCRITAPFNGVVLQRLAQVGGLVSSGTPLLELVENDRFELAAQIPDEIAESLQRADAIEFRSRNQAWPVSLLRLSPVIETERRSRQARFAFTDSSPAIGRNGEVSWRVSRGLLPSSLVVRRDGMLGIFLAEDGKAKFTVLPGAQEGRPVPVNLPLQSRIVVTGRDKLQDGDLISVQ